MGAGTSKPISFDGVNWVEIISIFVAVFSVLGSVVAIILLAKKSGPSGVLLLTENSGLSQIAAVATSLFVAYLPMALLWLGPMLSIFLVKLYFLIPTAGCIITFFTVGAFEQLLLTAGSPGTLQQLGALNK